MIRLKLLTILTALLVLWSFTLRLNAQNDPLVLDQILSQDVCIFPCWQNIIPGETTSAGVFRLLGTIDPILSARSIIVYRAGSIRFEDTERRVFAWWYENESENNAITTERDIVYSIELEPRTTTYLEQVLLKFGEPDAVSIEYGSEITEMVIYRPYRLQLIYPQHGLYATFQFPQSAIENQRFILSEKLELEKIMLFASQENAAELVRQWYPIPIDEDVDNYIANLIPWTGFGTRFLTSQQQAENPGLSWYQIPDNWETEDSSQ